MSHHIDTARDFQIALVPAWHKLTTIKSPEKTDFPEIIEAPLSFRIGKGKGAKLIELGGIREEKDGKKIGTAWGQHVAISTDDNKPCGNPFDTMTYSLFTPREAWEYVEKVLAGTGYEVVSIGMLCDRRKWFISTELKELNEISRELTGRMETKLNLNFSGGLDKNFSPQAELSSTVIVCHNTLIISRMLGEILFKIKATKNFDAKLMKAAAEIERACGMAAIFAKTMKSLESVPCTARQAKRLYTGFLVPANAEHEAEKRGEKFEISTRSENLIAEFTDRFSNGIALKGESMYDAFQSFTEVRTRGLKDSKKDIWGQYESSEFGGFADEKAEFAQAIFDPEKREKLIERGDKLLELAN